VAECFVSAYQEGKQHLGLLLEISAIEGCGKLISHLAMTLFEELIEVATIIYFTYDKNTRSLTYITANRLSDL
jgi:hypothetical protein